MKNIKIVIGGDGAVGKTTLMQRLVGSLEEIEKVKMTAGIEIHTIIVELPSGEEVKCSCFDLGGQEQFHFLHADFFKGAEIIIFMYSVEWFHSFKDLTKWESMIHKNTPVKKIYLIANKIDSPRRLLYREEGIEFAKARNWQYHEISAMTGENVDHLRLDLEKTIKNIAREKKITIKQRYPLISTS